VRVIRPAGGSAASRLVALAMGVPAHGPQAAAWQVRGLAELTLQAVTTGEAPLLAAVDAAAATIPTAPFADRLAELRRHAGPVPARYPVPCPAAPPAPPPPAVLEAARRLAAVIDAATGGLAADGPAMYGTAATADSDTADGDAASGGVATQGAVSGVEVPLDVATVDGDLTRLAAVRPFGRPGHACRPLTVDSRLVWRGWFLLDRTPVFCVPAKPMTPTAAAMMFGLHVGVHLDHLAVLAAARGPATAARLQFGAGLLVAESVAMAVELSLLADPASALGASERRFLTAAAVDRLSRLPGIEAWGRLAAPDSPAMAAACAAASAGSPGRSAGWSGRSAWPPGESSRSASASAASPSGSAAEFAALSTLAAAYVAGPFRLAARGFAHPLVPAEARHALLAGWAAVERAEHAAPAGRPGCVIRRSKAARRTPRAPGRRFGRRGGGRR